jgi:hypothetical protein
MIRGVITISRRTHANDVAQAKVFEAVLRVELAEAIELVESAERSWLKRCERGIDDRYQVPQALVALHGRVGEIRKLLDAVLAGFLHD